MTTEQSYVEDLDLILRVALSFPLYYLVVAMILTT